MSYYIYRRGAVRADVSLPVWVHVGPYDIRWQTWMMYLRRSAII